MKSSLPCSRLQKASSLWWAVIAGEFSTCPSPSRRLLIILRYRIMSLYRITLQISIVHSEICQYEEYRESECTASRIRISVQWLINRNIRATISLCLSNVCCVFISLTINYILKWMKIFMQSMFD